MTALHLATPDDAPRLLPMMAAFHREVGITLGDEARADAVAPLLAGSPLGVAYLIGPQRSPIGYVVICFGWSIELGGMDGFIDEIYIRAGVRSRGLGSEVLLSLPKALAGAGLKALHLEVRRDDARARSLYKKLHFTPRDDYSLMTRYL
ncbi:GNAT family N-acetyltransferase [Litorivita pollutaquae]|uniref:GNAT family N-acetyltransferase n=1 Tax=Litorivita pollutaquae TaxID=2200892 RepID=A0A2V4NW64_9RHOB|nr:GNAT family N-acetyltransferase [Litorivita pollutaquae]PYC49346.1 GNAT family N-acetyltransferase [Litorivita pollutaquae]